MSTTAVRQIPARDIAPGQVVRLSEPGATRRLTFYVDGVGAPISAYANISGRACRLDGETALARGRLRFPLVRLDALVDVLRDAP